MILDTQGHCSPYPPSGVGVLRMITWYIMTIHFLTEIYRRLDCWSCRQHWFGRIFFFDAAPNLYWDLPLINAGMGWRQIWTQEDPNLPQSCEGNNSKLFACPLIKMSTGIAKKEERVHPDFPYLCTLLISIFDPKDNVGFVLTWRLRDGIGGLSPRMNTREDKAGSCCGLRRMWRYHQPLPPPYPKCSLLCTSSSAPAFQVHLTIGCILFNLHFPSILCMYTLLSSSAKRQKKYTLGVCDNIRLCDCETAWMNVLPTPWLSIWTSAEFAECRS